MKNPQEPPRGEKIPIHRQHRIQELATGDDRDLAAEENPATGLAAFPKVLGRIPEVIGAVRFTPSAGKEADLSLQCPDSANEIGDARPQAQRGLGTRSIPHICQGSNAEPMSRSIAQWFPFQVKAAST